MGQGDIIRVGVLGCGYWGPNHIRNFLSLQHVGTRMSMAADPDATRRRQIENMYPTVDVVADSEEILNNPDIDAVVLATPARMHFEQARKALEAGKHVLVEKPFTTRFVEATELARIAAVNDRVLMVGHTFQYAEAVTHIRDVISEGALGDLTYIRSLRLDLGLFRTDINVMWDLAPHDLSILLHVLERFPKTVQATARARVNRSILDVANITLDFGDQLAAHIIVSWLDPQKVRQMTFVGDRKMLVYDDMSPSEKIQIFDRGIDGPSEQDPADKFQYAHRRGDIVIPTIHETEPLSVECKHFIECCQLGKTPRSGAASGAAVTAIIEAAQQSVRRGGKPIALGMFDDAAPFADWLDSTMGKVPNTDGAVSNATDTTPLSIHDGFGRPGVEQNGRYKAMVIDPDESRRLFAADALTGFEPGFDVVTARDVDQATQWIESFVPDLLVVSENIEQPAAKRLMEVVMNAEAGNRCRVISVGHIGNGEAAIAPWHHAAVNEGVGLSEWLAAVQQVFKQGEVNSRAAN